MIEIDITSKTSFDNYKVLKVPELWKYDGKKLQINVMRLLKYVDANQSDIFPQIDIINLFPRLLEKRLTAGRARVIQELKAIALLVA